MSDDLLSLATLRTMTPTQAAARWMATEDRDEALFEQWHDENAENRAAWQNALTVWGVFDNAGEDSAIAAMLLAARNAGPDTSAGQTVVPEPANDRLWIKLLVAATAVFIVAATALFGVQGRWPGAGRTAIMTASSDKSDALARFGKADYVTGTGQTSIIDLPDGSRVTLAANTMLDVAFTNDRRDVRLMKGHGYFDIAHDPNHPFAVEAAGRVVTALGTRFDVDMTPGTVRVVLAQGSVSIAAISGGKVTQAPLLLHPGQAFAAIGDKAGTVTATNLTRDLSWREGFAAFDNRPLPEVIKALNRSTRAQMFILNPKVAAMRVTGQFRTGDIERFGRALRLVLPVRIVARGPDRYEIVLVH